MQSELHHRRCAICHLRFMRIPGSRDKICAECYNFRSGHYKLDGFCKEMHSICISCYKPFANDIGYNRQYVTCPRCRQLARERAKQKR